MSMSISVARLRIAREIQDAEAKLDEALLGQTALLTTMITARRETNSDPFEGHTTLLRLHKSQQALLTAGGELARVHAGLKSIQRDKAMIEECPPNQATAFAEVMEQAS
ncbi:MAG: hypothetical protein WA957_08180 [Alteraurantiacibacter sp.]